MIYHHRSLRSWELSLTFIPLWQEGILILSPITTCAKGNIAMINVMIIDDNEALRLGLRIFVEEESDMRVVGEVLATSKIGTL